MRHRDPTSLVDLHNHLIPGVDDGARDIAATLHSVERMTRLSIRKIISTPHIDGSLTLDRARLERRLDRVTQAWQAAAEAVHESFPEVQFRRGHEVALDVPDVDLSDPRLRMAGTSFVLVEWPRLHLPPGTTRVLAQLRAEGYRPIIAHPERYAGMARSLNLLQQWRDAGAYTQVNYASLVGRYGSEARATAMELLRRGWVDYLASDFHGHRQLKIYKREAWSILEAHDGAAALELLCRTNPSRVLEDAEPVAVPPIVGEHGVWARLKDMMRSESA